MDILVEKDGPRFLLTAKTDRGRDWLNDWATETSQWWGKSLIVKRWEIDGIMEDAVRLNLEVARRY